MAVFTAVKAALPPFAAEAPSQPLPGSHVIDDGAPGRRNVPNERLAVLLSVVVLLIFGAALVVSAHGRVTMAFGDSHDGRNAGVWASASRSLREHGPINSRLGTRTIVAGETTTYATHPPLIVLETSAAEAVLGEHPWVSRIPAWGGSLVALVLAWLLLRACRLRPLAASIGVAVGFGCPMVAVYGTMLDTPVVGLPFGIAVLLLWQRARTGDPAPTALVAVVTALAVLSSWLGLLTAGLVTVGVVMSSRRDRPAAMSAKGNLLGLFSGGLALTAWITWAYGSLQPLIDQFAFRSGTGKEAVGPGLLIGALRAYWPHVLTPWLLAVAIPALVAAVRHPATRAIGGTSLAVLTIWIVGLRDGALHHDYWAYWITLPLAIGIGVVADAALGARPLRRGWAVPGLAAVSACAAILSSVGVSTVGTTGAAVGWGEDGGALLRGATYPPTQATAWYLGDVVQPASWISYGAHRPATQLLALTEVSQLATSSPDDLVLVDVVRLRGELRGPNDAMGCRAGVPPGHAYALLPIVTLARNFQRSSPDCRPIP